MLLFLNVIYVLIAVAMIALILMQRGAGAQAGSGFGGGASGTVFGARGASSFLTKATKWLAIAFFVISLFMAWHATRGLRDSAAPAQSLGVMSQVPLAPAQQDGNVAVPAVPTDSAPAQAPATDNTVPAMPTPANQLPQPAPSEAPAPEAVGPEPPAPATPPAGG